MRRGLRRMVVPWGLAASLLVGPAVAGADTRVALQSLADLTLEQLGELRVTSVSGRPQAVQDAPASVYVITAQDIRRSAATSLPEVLRLAPTLQVAQTNAGVWAISARGRNDVIANKLLVLLDGRTIYSTLFAGVIWDMHDVVLEDIERIEVVSGPGGTLWGANAVNGVISIVTRSAAQTQGALASVVRSHSGGRETLRWGGRLGPADVRVYGIATDMDNTVRLDGTARDDARSRRQLGFRADWDADAGELMLTGDLHRAGDAAATRDAPRHEGGSLLARWTSRLRDGSPYRLQAYTWRAERDEITALRNRSRVWDLEFRHEPLRPTGQQLLWGLGWRQADDDNLPSPLVALQPAQRTLSWFSAFAQHQQRLAERWTLTTGLKAERNSYTGWELLPNLRLALRHDEQHTSWAGVSRAVRAPSRIDRDVFIPGQAPFFIAGGPRFESEVVVAYELGHNGRIDDTLNWSATLYHHRIEGLRAGIPGQVPLTVENLVDGHTTGLEGWLRWQARPDWWLEAGGFAQRTRLASTLAGDPRTAFPDLGNDPSAQWSLRSHHDLGRGVQLDAALRRVGALPLPRVPSYTALDLRLGWRISPALSVSLLGQNLLDGGHVEFSSAPSPSRIERRLALQAVWTL
ncbi:TonB-dependent receptor plug domain-containing protein [Ramlibacter rhizophilus]|nr:TonB-dependent receptor [Ramlibacter rhizophilus]